MRLKTSPAVERLALKLKNVMRLRPHRTTDQILKSLGFTEKKNSWHQRFWVKGGMVVKTNKWLPVNPADVGYNGCSRIPLKCVPTVSFKRKHELRSFNDEVIVQEKARIDKVSKEKAFDYFSKCPREVKGGDSHIDNMGIVKGKRKFPKFVVFDW